MNQQDYKSWSFDKFWESFKDPNPITVYDALRGFINYIRVTDKLKGTEQNFDVYIKVIINTVLNPRFLRYNVLDFADLLKQLITLFPTKLQINEIPNFYNDIFSCLREKEIQSTSKILLIKAIEESIIAASNYSTERQQKIADFMLRKLCNDIMSENQDFDIFSIKLLTLTTENFSDYISDDSFSELKKFVENYIKQIKKFESENLEIFLAFVSFLKAYSALLINDEICDFLSFIEKMENKSFRVFILAAIIEHCPMYFDISEDKDENFSFVHYQDIIFNQISNPEKCEKSNFMIESTIQYLNTLSVLIDNFSNKMTEEQLDKYIVSVFDFLNFDIFNENEDNKTWKIRIAAMKLAISLIKEQNELFNKSLFYILEDENIYMPSFVTNLISDQNIESKMEALNFLKIIIHHSKNEIQPEVINDFENTLILQINEKDQVLNEVIITFATIIFDLKKEPTLELSLKLINAIIKVRKKIAIEPVLTLITNILKYSNDVKIINLITQLMIILLGEAKPSMITTCLYVVSKIYYYYSKCKKDEYLKKVLNDLNEIVFKIPKTKIIGPHVIATLSVFVSCCPDLSTTPKSLDLIVTSLDNNLLYKNSIIAIAQIAASNSAQLLSKYAKQILGKLMSKIESTPCYINQSLWAIFFMVQKEILTQDDFQDFVDKLFDIIKTCDKNSSVLILKIINKIYSTKCDSKQFCSLVDFITKSPLDDQIVSEIFALLSASAKASLNTVKPFVDLIINKVRQEDFLGKNESEKQSILSNLAIILSITSSSNNDYLLSLISTLKSDINNKGNSQMFALKCIGEIGSLIDLSNTDLVNSILNLVHDDDINVFIPASESIGLMSVGSPTTILTNFINAAKEDDQKYLTIYLFGIKSFVKKVNSIKNHMDKTVFDQIKNCIPMISDFLLPYTKDDFKDISLIVSECLSGLIGISFDYTKQLINMATYTTINAIYIYMSSKYSKALTEKEKEEVISLVEQVDAKYDDEKPLLDSAIMLCIKFALTKNLCKELYEKGFLEKCLIGIESQQSHNIIKKIGVEQITVNIGTQLKSTSLSCVELFIKSDILDQLDYEYISNLVLISFATESLSELLKKALNIITLIANLPLKEIRECAISSFDDFSTVDVLNRFEKMILKNGIVNNELKESYFNTVLSLLHINNITKEDEIKLKNILSKHQNDPILVKINEENQLKGLKKPNSLLFSANHTCSKLIEEFYPDAAPYFYSK